jgi:3-oxoacyl-(acyl-carrier-protein) synthase
MMKEGAQKVLIGAYEEVGEFNYAATLQDGELKKEPCNNLETYNYENCGSILGEGAAFFVLENEKRENTYGKLIGFHTFLSSDDSNTSAKEIETFFEKQGIALSEVDVVLTGVNGKEIFDKALLDVTEMLFPTSIIAAFKHLCGEYMTASAFAFWLAAKMLKTNTVPDVLVLKNANRKPKTILIYNQYLHYHSLILFQNV